MKKGIKKVLSWFFYIMGWVVGIFVGGFLLFIQPVYQLITSLIAGNLTIMMLVICIVKIFVASTVGGAIWCVFDIIAGLFREIDKND